MKIPCRPTSISFTSVICFNGERTDISTEGLTLLHEGWLAYVTGRTGTQPAQGEPWFTEDERRHMSDVRTVFDWSLVTCMDSP